ncbi:MAG TPA: hypothetical protein DD979_11155, partial [Gammaproteobacteria bacterium]|nr:hypothetical protein [Gammaproteobacteria bacterium]
MKRVICLLSLFVATPAISQTLVLPPSDVDLVGDIKTTLSVTGDSLLDIARRHHVGQEEIVLANPSVDRWLPAPGSTVILPSRYVLPDSPRQGIVLNLPEMRIYYYPDGQDSANAPRPLVTHPVSVGRMDWNTPLGTTKVVAKKKDPSWTPPESIRREHEADGDPLPKVVPAGLDNPGGQYAMRLGIGG